MSKIELISDDEKEVEAAIVAVEDARKLQASLYAKREAVATAQATKTRLLAESALEAELSGVNTGYLKIEGDLARLASDASRIDAAQTAAGIRLHLAEQALHAIGVETHVKTAKRLTTQRTKAASAMVAALADYANNYATLANVNEKIIQSWPYKQAPAGAMLHPMELMTEVQNQIAKLKPVRALEPGQALPGAAAFTPYRDQAKYIGLLETFDVANAHIIAVVEKGPG